MLLTTHYMDEVEYLCNRIGIMDNGNDFTGNAATATLLGEGW